MEEWKQIKNFPKYYVSNLGRVKSYKRKNPIIMSPGEYSNGYLFVLLSNGKNKKSCSIHRLVLETFNPVEKMELLQVNHKDCNRKNNNLSNLEWVTPQENFQYRDKLKHTPKAETVLVQFLDDREDMIFDSITACANYFKLSRKAINRYLESQNIRSDRQVQAHFYRLGRTSEITQTSYV